MSEPGTTSEAKRLEQLWGGGFGDDYVERNADAYAQRGDFWRDVLGRTSPASVLEIGCNMGGNLRWIAPELPDGSTYGVDINHTALRRLHEQLPRVSALWSPARELPFRDRWFDLVFTMGVLIHQPESTLPLVMAEMVRCSRRYVLFGEYHADETTEVGYHGHEGALFKRDYERTFLELFPELRVVDRGFLGRDTGWDDITWCLFERG